MPGAGLLLSDGDFFDDHVFMVGHIVDREAQQVRGLKYRINGRVH